VYFYRTVKVKGWRTEQQNRAPWKVSNCPFPLYPSPIDPPRAVGNPFDLLSHVPIGVFDRDLESGGVKCLHLQTNVSIVNANIDRHRIRMLNFPQFIVVYFLFPRRSLTHHQVFFFWLTNKSQNRTASDEPREELGA